MAGPPLTAGVEGGPWPSEHDMYMHMYMYMCMCMWMPCERVDRPGCLSSLQRTLTVKVIHRSCFALLMANLHVRPLC